MEQLRRDKDFVKVDTGHFVVELTSGRRHRVLVVALDDLGNSTVVLASNRGFRQFLGGEVKAILAASDPRNRGQFIGVA